MTADDPAHFADSPEQRMRYFERRLLVASGAVAEAEALAMTGLSGSALERHVQDGHILAFPCPDSGNLLYPAHQFRDGRPAPGLREVAQAFGDTSGWHLLDFLVSPCEMLRGERPLDLLHRGENGRVLQWAALFGDSLS